MGVHHFLELCELLAARGLFSVTVPSTPVNPAAHHR